MIGKGGLDFNDLDRAYKNKSDNELRQALWMFQLLNNKILGPSGKFLLKLSVKLRLPIKPLIKATLYKQFVGGESLEDSMPVVYRLAEQKVKSILDFSEEGKESENEIEKVYEEILRNIRFSAQHSEIPLCVFKPTAIASAKLLEKVSNDEILSESEMENWKRARIRFDKLCNTAFFNKMPIMIDAEESWIQKAIDDLCLEMMEKYNKERVTVINTYQLYRKDRLEFLKDNFELANKNGFRLGVKIVRGAYMEKERKRAMEMKYASPIHESKEGTDKDFNDALRFCMSHMDKIFLVVATHNEESNILATDLIHQTTYKKNYPYLWFSQLLGMSDHISFTLAGEGFNVAKYVPYGPVKAVTPYLVRRAEENSSVEGQSRKEIEMLKMELKKRKEKNKQ